MDLKTDYNNYLEEIRKEPEKAEIKLILADKLIEDGYSGIARLVQWFAKKGKWMESISHYYDNDRILIYGQ